MCFVLSIIMANVIINFDGMFISSVSGQSSEKESEGSIVIKDPKLKAELIVSGLEFPTSIAFIDKNDDLSMCNKLKSFDKVLWDTWIERKITDEQVMYLGQQVKELMVEAGCID